MKKWLLIWTLLLPVLTLAQTAVPASDPAPETPAQEEEFDMTQFIFGHIADSYEWHITTIGEKEIAVPLPCIVIDDGLHVFTLHHAAEHGYALNEDGKLVKAATGERPIDISITKNVVGLFVAAILLLVLILSCARWYREHDVLKEKPTGLAALLEPVIVMIEQDVIKDAVGPEYKKYSPYLLTAFFFILINNLLGIIPFFPFGANVTGNIAVTFVLAMFTFLMVNLFGSKHYWKEILWPDVPIFLKAIPIMPLIEILGMFTKPFSLMIRLFANILAGHIMILSVVALIFLTAAMGPVLNGSMTFVAALFGVFLDCLEILVAFIQAYVFTMLSAVFIGLAHPQPDHETN
ncbi:MAG: F0F1 ATP synthase subunit A [Bacteroidales bacterium]|nr:F0F1 ATP synthase subunit A [Bacteroidales bacterium]